MDPVTHETLVDLCELHLELAGVVTEILNVIPRDLITTAQHIQLVAQLSSMSQSRQKILQRLRSPA